MKYVAAALTTATLLIAVGCVISTKHTIEAHITVDIRHIQDEASSVLDYVEGGSDSPLPGMGGSLLDLDRLVHFAADVFSPIRPVYAAEMKTSSPLVTQIAKKMRERYADVERYLTAGTFGENNRGYLEMRNLDALETPDERNAAQKLMAEENADRKNLYQEVARVNKDSAISVSDVEGIYALERVKRAPTKPGQYFQLPPAGGLFDQLKDTDVAKKLGEKFVPGAWIKF